MTAARDSSTESIRLGRVLIVEDEPLYAHRIASLLDELGADAVDICHTRGGAETAVGLHGATYGFAMLDLQLHETDSLSIADRLDELDVPFAFVTGFASTRPDLHDHGAVAVLSKPVPVEGLRAVLEQVLGLREPETPT